VTTSNINVHRADALATRIQELQREWLEVDPGVFFRNCTKQSTLHTRENSAKNPAMQSHRIGPTTSRLIHRAFTPDNAEAFFALNSHPEVMRYTGEEPLASLEQARAAIEHYPDFDTVGFGRWACVLRSDQSLIGFCGLKYLEDLDLVDIGFRFLPEFWGQGLATEAATACIAFGFDVLKLREIIGLVLPENGASIRVLEKIGMQREGGIVYDGLTAWQYKICRQPN